jgi:hypothetical protein
MMVLVLACNIIAVPCHLMTVCVVAGCFGRFPTGILLGPKLIFVVEMFSSTLLLLLLLLFFGTLSSLVSIVIHSC